MKASLESVREFLQLLPVLVSRGSMMSYEMSRVRHLG